MADKEVQEIKDKIDIVDLVGSYVQLKKAGTNFRGLCPFHHEKSGSFMVSPQKQIFHCFGCGEGGDLFEFVKKIENVDFKDALKILAEKAGVKLPEYSKKDRGLEEKQERLLKINAFAAEYYHKYLLSNSGKDAHAYLSERGLLPETIEKWKIGFAPDNFHALEKPLMTKGVRVLDMLEAGVSVKSASGAVFDRFRNRITFPIFNYMGECVGFSARVFKASEDSAKYINSPETSVYNKSKVLFGLNFAKTEIRKKDYVIVVEGQMDCIKPQQAGFTNIVATSGTALTEEHLKLLKRLTSNIMFCFDSDSAGQKALKRGIELALPLGFSVKVIRFKEAKDPDELVSRDPQLFAKAIKESVWAVDYYIEKAQLEFNPGSIEQKKFVTNEILPLVNLFTDRVEQEHYLGKITEAFKISSGSVEGLVAKKDAVVVMEESKQANLLLDQEKQIMGGVIEFPEFREQILPDLNPEDYLDPTVRKFFTLIKEAKTDSLEFKEMLESSFAKEASFMANFRLQETQQNKEAAIGELLKSFYLLRFNGIKNKLKQIAASMKTAEITKDFELTKKLTSEYQTVLMERKKFEQFL